MNLVSTFEFRLLQILKAMMGRLPYTAVARWVRLRMDRPDCLSPTCVRMIQDMIGKGVVVQLSRWDGWKLRPRWRASAEATVDSDLVGATPRESLELSYGEATIELLLWLTSSAIGVDREWAPKGKVTFGDQLMFWFAFDLLRDTAGIDRYIQPFSRSALCQLSWPERIPGPHDWSPWLEEAAPPVLEAIETRLLQIWIENARQRIRVASPKVDRSLARFQSEAWSSYLDNCEASRRWDLARPMLLHCATLLREYPDLEDWCQSLDLAKLSVSRRVAARRTRVAMLSELQRLGDWTTAARRIGYVDEEYRLAQHWLELWGQLDGDRMLQHADQLRRAAEPLQGVADMSQPIE